MKVQVKFFAVFYAVGWVFFTLADLIHEKRYFDFSGDDEVVVIFILAVLAAAAYIFFMSRRIRAYDENGEECRISFFYLVPGIKKKILLKLIWTGFGIVSTIFMCFLLDTGVIWQNNEILNGIEYGFFGLVFTFGPLAVFILYDIIMIADKNYSGKKFRKYSETE